MRIFIVVTALLCAGCSTTPVLRSASKAVQAQRILQPALVGPDEQRSAPVLLIRDEGFMGSFVDTVVSVDGKDAVILKPGERFEFFLSPGNHMFSVRGKGSPLSEAMAETDIAIRPSEKNAFRLRLVYGDGPRIERSFQILQ